MRYLWTKQRRAYMMLIRIRFKQSRKWLIPVPIWVIEETIQAVYDIVRILERILKAAARPKDKKVNKRWREYLAAIPVSSVLKAGGSIIRELRKQGRFRLVEVEDSDIQVYVDLF